MRDGDLINPNDGGRELALPQGLDQRPAAVYLATLSPGSRRTMRESLTTIAHWLGAEPAPGPDGRDLAALVAPWHELRYQHTAAVRSWLAEQYAPATANKMLAALKGVLKQAWLLGQMTAEDYHRAVNLEPVKGASPPRGRSLAGGELAALMAACATDDGPAGPRDAAIISVLYLCGLRRGSLVALNLADYDPATGDLNVRKAKGRKAYRAHLADPSGQAALDDWLAVRGDEPGPLFYPVNKGGKIERRRLTEQAVYKMLGKRALEAGVEHFSPHDLRRTMAGDLLDRGVDISTVKGLLNHANVQTTVKYDRRPEAVKRKAAALLHIPWIRRKK